MGREPSFARHIRTGSHICLRLINYRQNKHVLFGQQEGLCGGCKVLFPFRNFTVDHIIPLSRGGTDHLENLTIVVRGLQLAERR